MNENEITATENTEVKQPEVQAVIVEQPSEALIQVDAKVIRNPIPEEVNTDQPFASAPPPKMGW